MAVGDLALVLHAHLPYVRSGKAGSLEEAFKTPAAEGDATQPVRVPSARD